MIHRYFILHTEPKCVDKLQGLLPRTSATAIKNVACGTWTIDCVVFFPQNILWCAYIHACTAYWPKQYERTHILHCLPYLQLAWSVLAEETQIRIRDKGKPMLTYLATIAVSHTDSLAPTQTHLRVYQCSTS